MTYFDKKNMFFEQIHEIISDFSTVFYNQIKEQPDYEAELKDMKLPKINDKNLLKAYKIFMEGVQNIYKHFLNRNYYMNKYEDVIDRNEAFDDKLVSEVVGIFSKCQVPVNIVNDDQ